VDEQKEEITITQKPEILTPIREVLNPKDKSGSLNVPKILLFGLGCLLLTFAFCGGGYFFVKKIIKDTQKEVKQTLPFQIDPQKEEDKFEKPKQISNSVIVGKVQWEVLEAKEEFSVNDKSECTASDGNKLVYLKVKIKNLDRAFVTVAKSSIDIYDKDKTMYSISNNKTFNCLGDQKYSLKDKYIPPILKLDEEETFEFIYEVPKTSKSFKLKVGDLSTVGREFEYIELGF
jgi:hypothetical protein